MAALCRAASYRAVLERGSTDKSDRQTELDKHQLDEYCTVLKRKKKPADTKNLTFPAVFPPQLTWVDLARRASRMALAAGRTCNASTTPVPANLVSVTSTATVVRLTGHVQQSKSHIQHQHRLSVTLFQLRICPNVETRNPHKMRMPHGAEVPYGAVILLCSSPVCCAYVRNMFQTWAKCSCTSTRTH